MERPRGYVDQEYLRIAAERTAPSKKRSYELLRIQSRHRVLDLGCGPGTDTIPLAHLVGPSGQIVGVDHDAQMIAAADRHAAQAGVNGWVTHQQGDAATLAFDAETFDSSRSERMFQHLDHPERALAEMVRVTRRGGSIVVLDTDWGTGSIDTPYHDLERRLMRVLGEITLVNGYSGRQLYRLFKQAGLAGITFELFTYPVTDYTVLRQIGRLDLVEQHALEAGIVAQDELEAWRADLEHASEAGTLFGCATMVLVAARKP